VERVRRSARALSGLFSGVVGVLVFVTLGILGVISTALTAANVLHVSIDPALLLVPAALVVAGNVVYRETQRRRQADAERDAAEATLAARPDPAAIVRLFLTLHDEGPTVLEPFNRVLEALPDSIPVGEQRYREWIALCTAAIEKHRPAYALKFRQSQAAPIERSLLVRGGGTERWVDMSTVERYRVLVAQSMGVLAEIVNAG
jgi:hypothetical protein